MYSGSVPFRHGHAFYWLAGAEGYRDLTPKRLDSPKNVICAALWRYRHNYLIGQQQRSNRMWATVWWDSARLAECRRRCSPGTCCERNSRTFVSGIEASARSSLLRPVLSVDTKQKLRPVPIAGGRRGFPENRSHPEAGHWPGRYPITADRLCHGRCRSDHARMATP